MRLVTSQRRIACVFAAAGVVSVAACESGTDVDNRAPCADAAPLTASLTPPDPSVSIGNRVQLTPRLQCGPDGPPISTNWQWTSSAPDIASVDAAGLVTAVARGTATVSARSSRYAGAVAITSLRAFAFSAGAPSISPNALIMHPGSFAQLRATVSDDPNAPVDWSISNPAVASIDASGLLRTPRCGLLGTAVITATSSLDRANSATAALTVTSNGSAPVTIQAVIDSITSQPVVFSRAFGTIVIRVRLDERVVECGDAARVELIVTQDGGREILVRGTPPIFPETTADVYFDTAARGTNGQPRTPNGSYSIAARAFDPTGRLIDESPRQAITFDNP